MSHSGLLSIILLASFVVSSSSQIISTDATCRTHIDCTYPKQCCFFRDYKSQLDDGSFVAGETGQCCYRGNYYGGYGYYRLSFWNVWYFWFVVIFILLSCFGGCGYWRRRQWRAYQNHRALPVMGQPLAPHHPLSLAGPPASRHHLPHGLQGSHRIPPVTSSSPATLDPLTGRLAPRLSRHHGLASSSPTAGSTLPHPQGFVAPPGFDLYAAHAASRMPAMFSPSRGGVAESQQRQPRHPYGSPASHLRPASGLNDVDPRTNVEGTFSGGGFPAPPPYVEVVGGAADAKDARGFEAGVSSVRGHDKTKDLPPSYAEAVAQMMVSPPPPPSHRIGVGSVSPGVPASLAGVGPPPPFEEAVGSGSGVGNGAPSLRATTSINGVYDPISSPPPSGAGPPGSMNGDGATGGV